MRYKNTGFISVILCLLFTACSHKVVLINADERTYCKLQQFEKPIQLELNTIKPLIDDFEKSRLPYDALWVKINGGSRLLYSRIQLQDQNIWSCSGEEGAEPHYVHRIGYQKVEQMFINISSAHYTEQPFASHASEPSMDILLVKKAGVIIFSYALDRECLNSLAAEDEAKIAQAKALSDYMRKLI